MGASNIVVESSGKDARDAYNRAVKHARDEYGRDPYNGSISTTDGFVLKSTPANITSSAPGHCTTEINAWLDVAWDNTQKWGAVWAIELPTRVNGQRMFLFAGWAAE